MKYGISGTWKNLCLSHDSRDFVFPEVPFRGSVEYEPRDSDSPATLELSVDIEMSDRQLESSPHCDEEDQTPPSNLRELLTAHLEDKLTEQWRDFEDGLSLQD